MARATRSSLIENLLELLSQPRMFFLLMLTVVSAFALEVQVFSTQSLGVARCLN
jgi:hypothetical protein